MTKSLTSRSELSIIVGLIFYRVDHKKRSQLCSDVVRFNSRIQTKMTVLKSNHS